MSCNCNKNSSDSINTHVLKKECLGCGNPFIIDEKGLVWAGAPLFNLGFKQGDDFQCMMEKLDRRLGEILSKLS